MIGSSSIGSNQDGTSSPSGATGTTPASLSSPGCSASRSAMQAAERGAGDHDGIAVRPGGDELGGERVELREQRAGRERGRLAEAGQVDRDRAPSARGSSLSSGRHVSAEWFQPCSSTMPGPSPSTSSARVTWPASSTRCSTTGGMCRGIPAHRQSMTRCQTGSTMLDEMSATRTSRPPRPLRLCGSDCAPIRVRAPEHRPSPPPMRIAPAGRHVGRSAAQRDGNAPGGDGRDGAPASCPPRLGRGRRDGRGRVFTIVPDLVALAWLQSRMVFFIAGAYGWDPRDPMRPAELLALTGLYHDPAERAWRWTGRGRRSPSTTSAPSSSATRRSPPSW